MVDRAKIPERPAQARESIGLVVASQKTSREACRHTVVGLEGWSTSYQTRSGDFDSRPSGGSLAPANIASVRGCSRAFQNCLPRGLRYAEICTAGLIKSHFL